MLSTGGNRLRIFAKHLENSKRAFKHKKLAIWPVADYSLASLTVVVTLGIEPISGDDANKHATRRSRDNARICRCRRRRRRRCKRLASARSHLPPLPLAVRRVLRKFGCTPRRIFEQQNSSQDENFSRIRIARLTNRLTMHENRQQTFYRQNLRASAASLQTFRATGAQAAKFCVAVATLIDR